MPRTQRTTDTDLFSAALRVMQRVGPTEFTLGAVAEEAGVTAGLLVQRFGSKHAFRVRLAESAAENFAAFVEQLRDRHRSAISAIRDYVDCIAGLASSPEVMVRSLAYLTEDLSDPALRRPLARQSETGRALLEAMIRDGVARGELIASTPPKPLARAIEAMIPGAMLTWATYREGSASTWIRREVNALLRPYLAGIGD